MHVCHMTACLDLIHCHLALGLEHIDMKGWAPLCSPIWLGVAPTFDPLSSATAHRAVTPAGPRQPIIWFCLAVWQPLALLRATGNSWRALQGLGRLRVKPTGAPVFASTRPHYHWIMVIINTGSPGGVATRSGSLGWRSSSHRGSSAQWHSAGMKSVFAGKSARMWPFHPASIFLERTTRNIT